MGNNAQILIVLISALCLAGCSDEYSVSNVAYDATGWDIFEPDTIRLTCQMNYQVFDFNLLQGHNSFDADGNAVTWSKKIIEVFYDLPGEDNDFMAEIDRRTLEIGYWNWDYTVGKRNRYNSGQCSLVDLTPKI